MTLGSLFDGSGGFPLAGLLVGITPVWSSEIEAYPLRVTAARFPDVKQLGDVTKINGAEIDPVDIITFGSPCQDLSVAGKQLGIHDGQRSNLFFEAVRIIKEMRDADKANGRSGVDIRPRFAVWENVPGAFSSNGGEDFKAVLEALAGVVQDGLDIPRPKKWNNAGCMVGNGWSIAWRVYDAQYWGVPQRRKRIYLVADFGSERAGEILFERESVSGDSSESGTAREGTAADAEGCAGRSGGVWCLKGNFIDRDTRQNGIGWRDGEMYTLCATDRHGVCYPETARTLAARHDSSPCVDRGQNVVAYTAKRFSEYDEGCGTLRANGRDVGGVRRASSLSVLCYECQNVCTDADKAFTLQAGRPDQQHIPTVVYDARGNGDGDTAPTMTGDHERRLTDYTAVLVEKHE